MTPIMFILCCSYQLEKTNGNKLHKISTISGIGKHVAIKKPDNSGSLYFNYKKWFIVVTSVANVKFWFMMVDVEVNRRISDGER